MKLASERIDHLPADQTDRTDQGKEFDRDARKELLAFGMID